MPGEGERYPRSGDRNGKTPNRRGTGGGGYLALIAAQAESKSARLPSCSVNGTTSCM